METIRVQRPVVLYPGNNRPIQGPDFGGHRRFIFEVFKKGNFCVEFKRRYQRVALYRSCHLCEF